MSTEPVTAADLVAHPERIAEVEPATVPALLTQLATVTAALAVRLPALANGGRTQHSEEAARDRLLTAEQASATLQMSRDFLRRSPVAKPFRVYVGRELRFSARGIERFIASRAGRE